MARRSTLLCLVVSAAFAPAAAAGITEFEPIASFGSLGSGDGQLMQPGDVELDAAGNVYVADKLNHRVVVYSPTGTFLRAWGKGVDGGAGYEVCSSGCVAGSAGGEAGELSSPTGIAVDTSSPANVYVADSGNHRIAQYQTDGTFIRAWGKNVDEGGVAGFEACPQGANSCQTGTAGTAGGELNNPVAIASHDISGHVFVMEAGGLRVSNFDETGAGVSDISFIRAFGRDVDADGGSGAFEVCTISDCKQGETGGGLGVFGANPQGIGTGVGTLYAADTSQHRVNLYQIGTDPSLGPPVPLAVFGSDVDQGGGFSFESCSTSCKPGVSGGFAGEFNSPRNIHIDSSAHPHVADTGNRRVQEFVFDGGVTVSFVRAFGRDVVLGAGSGGFEICDNLVYPCQAGTQGTALGSFDEPTGVALDADDNVYVSDADTNSSTGNARIQKFGLVTVEPPTPPPGPPGPPAGRCAGKQATKTGTAAAETIVGTARRDVIDARGGNDRVLGLGGKDILCGKSGRDRLSGGAGRDRLIGGAGRDRLSGGAGRDFLKGGPGRDRCRGGSGRDRGRSCEAGRI